MEHTHLFIVDFGDGDRYRYYCDADNADAASQTRPFVEYDKEIRQYLSRKFPGVAQAFYVLPDMRKIDAKDVHEYEGFELLDDAAVERIKHNLARAMNVRADVRELNSNDAFGGDSVSPQPLSPS